MVCAQRHIFVVPQDEGGSVTYATHFWGNFTAYDLVDLGSLFTVC